MKVYLFYIFADGFNESHVPILYAYTNNKEYAKRFRETRNMDIFIEDVKHVDKSEYNELTMNFHNRGSMLVETKLLTSHKHELTKVNMIMTQHEEDVCILKTDDVFEELAKYTSIQAVCFNDDVIDALNTLYYFDIMKMYSAKSLGIYNENFNIPKDTMIVDQLQFFILKFGYTMK